MSILSFQTCASVYYISSKIYNNSLYALNYIYNTTIKYVANIITNKHNNIKNSSIKDMWNELERIK